MASGGSIFQYFKSNVCFKKLKYRLLFIDEDLNFETLNVPFVCVVNTKSRYDHTSEQFAHWVCLYYDGNVEKNIIFFDSLGMPPPDKLLRDMYNSRVFNSFTYGNFPIQSKFTDLCGLYIVMFTYLLFCEKFSIVQFLDLFSRNTIENDIRIFDIYNRTFGDS